MISTFNKKSSFELIITFLSGFALLFIIAPILGIYFNSSTKEIFSSFHDEELNSSIWLSLWTSMIGTLLFSVFAIPFAFLLARKNFRFKNFINGIIDLPIIIPHSAAGIALLLIVSKESFIGKYLNDLGLSFVNNHAGIILAMSFVSLPFLINSARDGFVLVPERLEKIALTLGASPTKVFFTITIPLAWRSILSGMILMWARGMSEFGAVIIIAYNPKTAPVLIYERFTSYGLQSSIIAATVFISITLIVFVILRMVKK
jgi:molybdate/tungstate transport system permease protein